LVSSALHPSEPTGGQNSPPVHVAVDVIAVTTRDDFLLELGQALGGQASINPVDTAPQALERLGQSRRTQVLMIDSRDLADLRGDVETIQAQFPRTAVLVFAEASAEQEMAAALKGSQVFAVLPIPVEPEKTAAVLTGAVADSKAKQALSTPPIEKVAIIETELTAPVAHEPIRPSPPVVAERKIDLRLLGGVTLAVLVAIILWTVTRDKASPPIAGPSSPPKAAQSSIASRPSAPVAQAPPTVGIPLVAGKVDALLEKARTAMRERRYTEPVGDNALLYYRSAANADPANGEAQDGLTRVATVLSSRFEEAMSKSDLEDAASMLAQFRSVVPSDARVADFHFRVTKLRAEVTRAQEESKKKQLAEERANREAAAAEQKKLREARAAAAETERKAELLRQREAQDKLKAAQATALSGTTSKPLQDLTSRGSRAALQSSLKRKRYIEPEYPQDALLKNIGGSVTIAYTVDVKGNPQDIRVESEDPAGIFDRATTDAVKRWRYEPLLIDGVPTEVPVRLTIRFAPP
jgi:TonB family protein